jgi:hypothetical protein
MTQRRKALSAFLLEQITAFPFQYEKKSHDFRQAFVLQGPRVAQYFPDLQYANREDCVASFRESYRILSRSGYVFLVNF